MKIRLLLCLVFALFTVACYGPRSTPINSFEGTSEAQDESSNLEDVAHDGIEENSDLANTDLANGSSEDEAQEGNPIFNSEIEPFNNSGAVCDLVTDISTNDNMVKTQETFEQDNISITYPQFESSEDAERIQELNDMIRDNALSVLEPLRDLDVHTVEITYEISLLTNDFISIIFKGYRNVVGAAGPTQPFYTLNVDLETMQRVRLTDIVHVDEGFANLLLDGEFTPVNPAQIIVLESYDTEGMLERLLNVDSHEVYSYFTEDRLGISLIVTRAAGHYANFEMLYTNENIEFQDAFSSHFGA